MTRYVLLSCLWSCLAGAVEPPAPTLPVGEDATLVGSAGVEKFFAAREANAECRARLDLALAAWRQAKGAASRKSYLAVMQECGPCAVREIERRQRRTGGRRENWYLSDGSCQLPGDPVARAKAFTGLVKSLKILNRYPARRGGFSDIVEFRGVDPRTGDWVPDTKEPVATSPFFIYVAVRGPTMLGVESIASYFVRNDIVKDDDAFRVEFRSTEAPEGFRAPDLGYAQLELPNAMGMWYLTRGGYIRYFTAADFPVATGLVADLAKRILLDTLVQLIERPEAQP